MSESEPTSLSPDCPVQIVKIDDDDHTFELDEEALKELLSRDERVKDKPICIVSVAGEAKESNRVPFILSIVNCSCSNHLTHERESIFNATLQQSHDMTANNHGLRGMPDSQVLTPMSP